MLTEPPSTTPIYLPTTLPSGTTPYFSTSGESFIADDGKKIHSIDSYKERLNVLKFDILKKYIFFIKQQ